MTTRQLLENANAAKAAAAALSTEKKNELLRACADSLTAHTKDILDANHEDVEAARAVTGEVMLDRLALTAGRVEAMACLLYTSRCV